MPSENIFAQYIQPLKSVDDWQAERDARSLRQAQLQGAQRQNALADLVGQQQRQAMGDATADRNALAALAAGWSASTTPEQRIMGLRNSGRPALMNQADTLEKQWLERRNTESQIGERGANSKKAAAETVGKHLDALKTLSQAVMANPTPQNASGALAQWEQMTGQVDQNERAQIAQLQTPQQVMAWARAHALKADDLKAQVFTNNTGGSTVTQSYDPVTGSLSTLGQLKNTQSPDNIATTGLGWAKLTEDKRHNGATEAQANGRVTYQTDANGNLVALPERVAPGTVVRGQSVVGSDGMKPLQGKQPPLPEAAQKQLVGTRNLQDAVANYREKLKGFGLGGMVSPDARAEMGNAYNNMMLQAKEAYNLGVLNGPDYDILQSVVKDPTKLGAAITSNAAMDKQAAELDRIARGIESRVLEAHGKPTPARAAPKPSVSNW